MYIVHAQGYVREGQQLQEHLHVHKEHVHGQVPEDLQEHIHVDES